LYSCRILADSINNRDVRLTTLEVTFPRFILAEFNTHRMLSRNSASSRAIPVEKIISRVKDGPFIPRYWGKNQKGMQAHQELTPEQAADACRVWLEARDSALQKAKELLEIGVHKQLANRLLEPFLWQSVIVTATEWDNFFGLRCHPDAQPEFQTIAIMMKESLKASTPVLLQDGEWHLPLISEEDKVHSSVATTSELARISAGRCARVSYLTHDGRRDPVQDIALCDRLITSGHMSPMEHPAMADSDVTRYVGNFKGFIQLRKTLNNESVFRL
jgi:thymidylate synthase ThyX